MRIWFGRIALVLTGALVVALVAGYGGRLHPVGDSLAVFRAYVSLALIPAGLLLIVLRHWRAGLGAMVVGALVFLSLGFVTVGPAGQAIASAGEPGQRYTLYQKNVLWLNRSPDELAADILDRNPDFVTLEEVHKHNRKAWMPLTEIYPAQLRCDFVGVGGPMILSRFDMVEGTAACDWGTARMQVKTPGGPVWLVATHLHWVYPYENAEQVAALEPILRDLDGPVIVGGDFNTVPWTTSFQDFAKAANVERIGPVDVSIVKFHGMLRVPIDHVLVTGGQGDSHLLPLHGSDHRGVWAEFTLPRS